MIKKRRRIRHFLVDMFYTMEKLIRRKPAVDGNIKMRHYKQEAL